MVGRMSKLYILFKFLYGSTRWTKSGVLLIVLAIYRHKVQVYTTAAFVAGDLQDLKSLNPAGEASKLVEIKDQYVTVDIFAIVFREDTFYNPTFGEVRLLQPFLRTTSKLYSCYDQNSIYSGTKYRAM